MSLKEETVHLFVDTVTSAYTKEMVLIEWELKDGTVIPVLAVMSQGRLAPLARMITDEEVKTLIQDPNLFHKHQGRPPQVITSEYVIASLKEAHEKKDSLAPVTTPATNEQP